MEQIKIQKKFWDKIVSGEKEYEFRKLEKGLSTGTYQFISIRCDDCVLACPKHNELKTYGTAHLKPIAINPEVGSFMTDDDDGGGSLTISGKQIFGWIDKVNYANWDKNFPWEIDDYNQFNEIDKETYDFVKKNYIDKDIDFMVYEISDVKENK